MKTALRSVAARSPPIYSPKSTNYFHRCRRHSIANRTFVSLRRAAAVSFLLVPSNYSSWCQAFPSQQQSHRTFISFGMSTHVTERDGSGTITVSPKNEADQSGLIVICHGLGDTGEGFADVAEQFASQMPHLKFVLPTAPTQPVTMNMGMPMPSWYDIVGLDERSNENCKGIEQSQDRIKAILQKEHEETGLPYSRMLLAGFSQGGALSLFTGLQLEEQLAGIIVWSGYLPAASKLQLKQPNTKIWHGHGTQDPLVQYAMAEKTKYMLLEKGLKDYDLHSYPIPHTVSPAELREAMQFLLSVLPPDESFKVQLKDPSSMSIKELKGAIRKAGLGNKAVGLMEKAEFVKLLQDHRAGKL
ncbi:carboxylesterase [Nitzschia inconspicua]|uniref:Carboxylesterase n=1 Tax=Nitzschia inconspicua TaxID=303405 RepID=A0A9K3PPP7_9STRA|nr:carboxylesterase [Nitzschia inconspicua]